MRLHYLSLTHIRAFDKAEFTFHPGMNLIVGINGVGKSTVLDALRILLSQALPQFVRSRNKTLPFTPTDITIGHDALTAELSFDIINNTPFTYLVHEFRASYQVVTDQSDGEDRERVYKALERHDLNSADPEVSAKSIAQVFGALKGHPVAVYFSTRRAITSNTKGPKTSLIADALEHRELRLLEFADWWLAQTTLAEEGDPLAQGHLEVLAIALSHIIDSCADVRAVRETYIHQDKKGKKTEKETTTLLIDKGDTTLDVRQLSDGERGMLALVLDLARRLSQAYPHLDDPLKEGSAVVLIDELDLHLHPRWQRTIVKKLTDTFPNCQFIATTHSPLIIGEVSPENIILLDEGHPPFRPDQSLGMDTDWILKYLMGATTRNLDTAKSLQEISELIETEEYDQASDAIDALRNDIGEFPELVRLQARLDRFQLLGE